MPINTTPYIVVIDDDINANQPLIGFLHQQYGEGYVQIFQHPNDGIKFVEENLAKRIIVLLDIMFNGQEQGVEVFNQIVEKSSLVAFIVMTGNTEQVSRKGLERLINGHAWHIIQRDRPAREILQLIKQVEREMAMRVDGALEEWIFRHNDEVRSRPFIRTRSGDSYSLMDILDSLRTGSNAGIGQRIAGDILQLAIDLIARDKTQIGKDSN